MGERSQWFKTPARAVPRPLERDFAAKGQPQLRYLTERANHCGRTLPPFLKSFEVAWSISLDGRLLPSTPRSAGQGTMDRCARVVGNHLEDFVHGAPEFEVILLSDPDDGDVVELICNLA